MRQLIAAVNVVIPRGEPHVDAVDYRVRLAHAVAHSDRGHHQYQAGDGQTADEDVGVMGWLSRESLQFVGQPVMQVERIGGYLDTVVPLTDSGTRVGTLHVGVSRTFYRNQIRRS